MNINNKIVSIRKQTTHYCQDLIQEIKKKGVTVYSHKGLSRKTFEVDCGKKL